MRIRRALLLISIAALLSAVFVNPRAAYAQGIFQQVLNFFQQQIVVLRGACTSLSIVTPPDLPDALKNKHYNAVINAEGDGPIKWELVTTKIGSRLPKGIAFVGHEYSAVIEGVPEELGGFTFRIRATDRCGKSVFQDFSLRVMPEACIPLEMKIGDELHPGLIGKPYLAVISAGAEPPLRWDFIKKIGSRLPEGLEYQVVSDVFVISGSPREAGDFTFTLRATDSCRPKAQTQIKDLVLKVYGKPICAPIALFDELIPSAQEGEAYFYRFTADARPGLRADEPLAEPLSFVKVSGLLPRGMHFIDGILSGVPEEGTAGEYIFTVRVRDSCPTGIQAVERKFSLMVHPPEGPPQPPQKVPTPPPGEPIQTERAAPRFRESLTIVPKELPDGVTYAEYSQKLYAVNTRTPNTKWTLNKGSLPDGLKLKTFKDGAGLIAGVPTKAGTYIFIIQVTEEDGTKRPPTVSQEYKLTIGETPFCSPLQILTDLPNGVVDQPYGVVFWEAGLNAVHHPRDDMFKPFNWRIVKGQLPPGLEFQSGGNIRGVPIQEGKFVFTLGVNDSAPELFCGEGKKRPEGTRDYEIAIFPKGTSLKQVTKEKISGIPEFRYEIPAAPSVKETRPPAQEEVRQNIIERFIQGICPAVPEEQPVPPGCQMEAFQNADPANYTLKWVCHDPSNPDFTCLITKNGQPFFTVRGSTGFFSAVNKDEFPSDIKPSEATIKLAMTAGNQQCGQAQFAGLIGAPPPLPPTPEPAYTPARPFAPVTQPAAVVQVAVKWFLHESSVSLTKPPIDLVPGRIYLRQLPFERTARLRIALQTVNNPLIKGKQFFAVYYALTPRFVDPARGYPDSSICNTLPTSAYRSLGGNIVFHSDPNVPHGSVPGQSLYDPGVYTRAIPQSIVGRNSFTTYNSDVPAGSSGLIDIPIKIFNLTPSQSDIERFRAGYPEYYSNRPFTNQLALITRIPPPRTLNEACFQIRNADGSLLSGGYSVWPSISE